MHEELCRLLEKILAPYNICERKKPFEIDLGDFVVRVQGSAKNETD